MGEAALKREFAKVPPREPLTSITALWRDYMWRYVTGRRGDPSQPYTAKSKNIYEAIQRACDSKGEDGKTFFHQGRVWPVNRQALADKMKADAKAYHWYEKSEFGESFDKLYQYVEMVGTETKGIGIVTIYDVTSRLAGYLGLEPEHLYFHAGVTVGLRAIGVEIPAGADRIRRERLPEFFQDKDLDLVESFLCGYRSEIERVMKEKKQRATPGNVSRKGSAHRRSQSQRVDDGQSRQGSRRRSGRRRSSAR